jgi:hypothetical protein
MLAPLAWLGFFCVAQGLPLLKFIQWLKKWHQRLIDRARGRDINEGPAVKFVLAYLEDRVFQIEPTKRHSAKEVQERLQRTFKIYQDMGRTGENPASQEPQLRNRFIRWAKQEQDRRGSAGEQGVQADSPTTRSNQMVPFSDSGYASTVNGKVEGKQTTQIEDHAQTSENFRSGISLDEGYVDSTNNTAQDDAESEDNRTVYSDAPSLPGLKDRSYISAFADDLVSTLRYEKADSQTMQRVSGILTELLKAFALKVGHNAPSQMHRDIMFFVHKYRR